MKINLKVRLRQKEFVVAMFSALLLAAQAILGMFGITVSEAFGAELTYTFNSVLSVLVLSGVILDPTTKGISDSEQVQEYDDPQ